MKRLLFFAFLFLLICPARIVLAEDTASSVVDTELKTIWNSMVTALTKKDIEGALDNFTYTSRWRYREQFKQAGDKLPEMASGMRNIEKVYIKVNEAKYRIRLNDNGKGYTGYIWFSKDMLGRWKVEKF
ncbi:MAG: hypothetical protein PH343_06495 [Nitrospira sp.]|nr:hypothetical protein [Nitrospira sp.]